MIARDLSAASADPEHSVESLVARARADDDGRVQPFWPRVFAAVSDVPVRRWQTAAATVAALGLATLGLLLLWHLRPIPGQVSQADVTALHFETRHGEQQTHRLADHSVLHLNTDTAVTVRYSDRERLVTLTSGEAEFEVTHESARPFRVFAGSAEVVDLGTRFDVRLGHQSTVVTVVEGHVAVGVSAPATNRSPLS